MESDPVKHLSKYIGMLQPEGAEQASTKGKRGIPKFPGIWELLLHRETLFHESRTGERTWRGIWLNGVSYIITDSPATTK